MTWETNTWTLIINKSANIFTEEDIIEICAIELWISILIILLLMFYSIFKK